MSILSVRNCFADFAHVESICRFRSSHEGSKPLVSIVIPTYRRSDLLKKTIRSAVNQKTLVEYEIVIVDNDVSGKGYISIEKFLRSISGKQISYYVNDHNIGMFGNWNRCIEIATGEWVSILNDDDLLDSYFIDKMINIINSMPNKIDGIVCRKNDYHRDLDAFYPDSSKIFDRIRLAVRGLRFDRCGLMKITSKKLFFGNDLRNSLGFLFKKQAAVELGGYKPEEFPAADYFFYVRFILRYNLYWCHAILASVGIGENESMNVDTSMQYAYQCSQLRSEMAESVVPASWIKMNPDLTSYSMANMEKVWNIKFDWRAAELKLGFRLPKPSINKIRYLRMLNGGY